MFINVTSWSFPSPGLKPGQESCLRKGIWHNIPAKSTCGVIHCGDPGQVITYLYLCLLMSIWGFWVYECELGKGLISMEMKIRTFWLTCVCCGIIFIATETAVFSLYSPADIHHFLWSFSAISSAHLCCCLHSRPDPILSSMSCDTHSPAPCPCQSWPALHFSHAAPLPVDVLSRRCLLKLI